MTSKLLVVVYDQDLPQFELMIYCLNKNWQGRRHITIIYQGNIKDRVLNLIESTFSNDWIINLIPSLIMPNLGGSDLQQLNKIIYSLDNTVQDVIVFDCKDFLLKPIDESYFKHANNYCITQISNFFDEFYPNVHLAMGLTDYKFNAILNITPWIWNVEQLGRYWSYVIKKYTDNLSDWTEFYPSSEIASYYYYTYKIDATPTIKFSEEAFMPSGGIWDTDTIQNVLQVVENFDRYKSAVWKHHRRITSMDKTAITAMQLQKYNIPLEIITKWIESKHYLRS